MGLALLATCNVFTMQHLCAACDSVVNGQRHYYQTIKVQAVCAFLADFRSSRCLALGSATCLFLHTVYWIFTVHYMSRVADSSMQL